MDTLRDTHEVIISADLGQRQDYTAISVVRIYESTRSVTPPGQDVDVHRFGAYDKYYTYEVQWLERWQGQRYNTALDRLEVLQNNQAFLLDETLLLIDATGLGRPILEEADDRGLDVTGIIITGGTNTRLENSCYFVPRIELINALVMAVETQRITIDGSIREEPREILRKELASLRIKRSVQTARESYETWREGDHDDMVLSLAQAIWHAEKFHTQERVTHDAYEEIAKVADYDTANWGLE